MGQGMSKTFYRVANIGDMQPGELRYVEAGGKAICLANVGGEVYALNNACTHEHASLADGSIDGERLECPLHGGAFNVVSGEPENYPVSWPVKTYSVRIEGDEIFVGIRE